MNERGAVGIWLNRLSLVALELEFEHEISDEGENGWRLKALEPGKAVAYYANGEKRGIDLSKGDTMLATPSEIYIGLNERVTPRRVKPKEAAPAARPAAARRTRSRTAKAAEEG